MTKARGALMVRGASCPAARAGRPTRPSSLPGKRRNAAPDAMTTRSAKMLRSRRSRPGRIQRKRIRYRRSQTAGTDPRRQVLGVEGALRHTSVEKVALSVGQPRVSDAKDASLDDARLSGA